MLPLVHPTLKPFNWISVPRLGLWSRRPINWEKSAILPVDLDSSGGFRKDARLLAYVLMNRPMRAYSCLCAASALLARLLSSLMNACD